MVTFGELKENLSDRIRDNKPKRGQRRGSRGRQNFIVRQNFNMKL